MLGISDITLGIIMKLPLLKCLSNSNHGYISRELKMNTSSSSLSDCRAASNADGTDILDAAIVYNEEKKQS